MSCMLLLCAPLHYLSVSVVASVGKPRGGGERGSGLQKKQREKKRGVLSGREGGV